MSKVPRPKSSFLVAIFFSALPIGTTIFGVCFGAGMLLIVFPLSNNDFLLAATGLVFLSLVFGWTLAPLGYRFMARAFPLNASGSRNEAALRRLRIISGMMLAICTALLALCTYLYLDVTRPARNIFEAFVAAMGTLSLGIFSLLLLAAICLTFPVLKVLALHRRPDAWSSQRFTLFLRSFGSVSDVAALGPLVRGAGRVMRVALLSSPGTINASWNPLALVMSGFSLRRPFRSVPVFLESTDATWASDVRRMAGAASVVVIDITHLSPGLAQEIEMLDEAALDRKTVRFSELEAGHASSASPVDDVLRLQRSPALRRWAQVLGFIFTYAGFVTLSALLVSIFDFQWSSMPGAIVRWSSLGYALIPAIWAAKEMAPEAGFTRDSARSMVDIIRKKADAAA